MSFPTSSKSYGDDDDVNDTDDDGKNDPTWSKSDDDSDNDNATDKDSSDEDEERLYILKKENKDIFIAKLIKTPPGSVVHHQVLTKMERKFLIVTCLEVEKYDMYNADYHTPGAFIKWDLHECVLKINKRKPVAALEKVIPEETMEQYKLHKTNGCGDECKDVCCFTDDKVYHEWVSLADLPPDASTPTKKKKRSRSNKKVERKKARLEGKPYVTVSGKNIPGKQPMKWADCKCKHKCHVHISMEERETIYTSYWQI